LLQLKDYGPHSANVEPVDFENDFFRDHKGTDQKNKPFTDALVAWDSDYYCAAINPEKFNILNRRQFKLAGTAETVGTRLPYCSHEKYFSVNKKITFETPTDTQPHAPFYLCHWAVAANPVEWTSAALGTYDAFIATKVCWKSLH